MSSVLSGARSMKDWISNPHARSPSGCQGWRIFIALGTRRQTGHRVGLVIDIGNGDQFAAVTGNVVVESRVATKRVDDTVAFPNILPDHKANKASTPAPA